MSQKYNRSTFILQITHMESENENNNSISHDLDNWFIISQKIRHFTMSM